MTSTPLKSFRIARDEAGDVRLTVREIRHNSQGYPWSSSRLLSQVFASVLAARCYAVARFGAKAGEFTSQ